VTAIRQAPFALRVVERKEGRAAIVYRRRADANGRDRLQRVAAISPLAYTAATPMLRSGVTSLSPNGRGPQASGKDRLSPGPYYPLDADWGAKIACFAILAAGLRDADRLIRAVGHVRHSNPDEAAWWLGLLTQDDNVRALRALRILTEAVE
jgi:hypothetical protein